jgi:hypothetical protein
MPAPEPHLDFAHDWSATILAAPPMIRPARQYMFPQTVAGEEEAMSRGALLVDVRPNGGRNFLAICALGFEGDELLSGVWSCPNPLELCAVAGGYAYVINAWNPKQCTHLELRPVVEVVAAPSSQLLLFVGFHSIAAGGADGLAWQTPRITWEGLRIERMDETTLHGFAWDMPNDAEVPFAVDLRSGAVTGGSAP